MTLFSLSQEFDMADYVTPEYSRSQIENAGRALAGQLTDIEEAAAIFRVAHNWREAHLFPMRRARFELTSLSKKVAQDAITVARIKRMKSIRKKLRETNYTLYQIQDIGGCRAIVDTVGELKGIVARQPPMS